MIYSIIGREIELAFEELARTTESGGEASGEFLDCLGGRAGPVRAFEELAGTTEAGAGGRGGFPDVLGRAGPVPATGELANNGGRCERVRFQKGRTGPVRF